MPFCMQMTKYILYRNAITKKRGLTEQNYAEKYATEDNVEGLVEAEQIPKRGMDKNVEGTQ